MVENFQVGLELEFIVDILLALGAGVAIGAERESRGNWQSQSIRFRK
jgi:uncharacterized membrane protein YhiD involved in acid resistance